MEVHGLAGKPLTLIARDELGHVVSLDSAMPLNRADKQPLTSDRLRQQLGRLGGTPFKLGELQDLLEGSVVLPVSELNRLRREAARQLETLRAQPKRWSLECGIADDSAATTTPPVALRTPHLPDERFGRMRGLDFLNQRAHFMQTPWAWRRWSRRR